MSLSQRLKNGATVMTILLLSACGGGGGGGSTVSETPGSSTTTVSGVVSKGLVSNGSVSIFAISNGAKGNLLKTTRTDAGGGYSADLGSYSGPVLVEVTGGSYTDEATGATKLLATPLRAAIDDAQGAVGAAVTPLTELAVRKAATLAPEDVRNANSLVSGIFTLDVIKTSPVAPTSAALESANQAQKDYTLALAAISQMSQESGAELEATLTALAEEVSAAGISSEMSARFQSALAGFVSPGNAHNKTGINDTNSTNLVRVGNHTKSYKLVLKGIFPASAVKGLQFDLLLPADATDKVPSSGTSVAGCSFHLSGGAPSDPLLASNFGSGLLKIAMVSTKGFSAGEFATLTCNIASGTVAPPASAFTIGTLVAIDNNGTKFSGITISVN